MISITRRIGITAALILMVLPLAEAGQKPKPEDIWRTFRVFIGNWQGPSAGEPGTGECQRGYRFIYGEKFIEVKNKSSWAPTAQNPQSEVHEDLGYISYDKARKTFVLRQFHIEGFVNQYRMESVSEDGKTIVFVSEAIENIAAGWRARETYRIVGPEEFSEAFDLAAPGKDFEPYTKTTLKRVK